MCGACGRSVVSDPVLGPTRTLRQHLIVAQTINDACQSWPGAPKVAATVDGWLVVGPKGVTEAVPTVEAQKEPTVPTVAPTREPTVPTVAAKKEPTVTPTREPEPPKMDPTARRAKRRHTRSYTWSGSAM